MNAELLNIVLLSILINSQLSNCHSEFENEREKRTVGVFFRNVVDAFQSQRQPAPNVVSFKPPRQSSPQSIKADIFSSSQTFLQQKKNLLKPASTQAPDTEIIPAIKSSPAASTPDAPAAPISQAPLNQPQSPPPSLPPNLPPTAPLDHLTNLIPSAGHHPLTPLKAQILILPFQGHQGSDTPFDGFGLQPHLPGGISPFNYQAEIYLQPPIGGVYPSASFYPGHYSPGSEWHDEDKFLSKGVHTPSGKEEDLTKLKDVELNKYEASVKSQSDDTKHIENPSSAGTSTYQNDGHHENVVEGHRRDGDHQDYQGDQYHYLSTHPLFAPQHLALADLTEHSYGNNYGEVDGGFHFDDQSHEFHRLNDEAYKRFCSEGLKNVQLESQATFNPKTPAPQGNQDRARVSDVGVVQRGDSGNTHDYMPQRLVDSKLKEKPQETQHQQQNYRHDHVQNLYPEHDQVHHLEYDQIFYPEHDNAHHPQHDNVHHPEHDYTHHPEQYNDYSEKDHLKDDQHHAKIGRLPSNYPESQDQYYQQPSSSHKPHQPLPAYDSNLEHTEINDSHPNGYYHFKRSYIVKRHY